MKAGTDPVLPSGSAAMVPCAVDVPVAVHNWVEKARGSIVPYRTVPPQVAHKGEELGQRKASQVDDVRSRRTRDGGGNGKPLVERRWPRRRSGGERKAAEKPPSLEPLTA